MVYLPSHHGKFTLGFLVVSPFIPLVCVSSYLEVCVCVCVYSKDLSVTVSLPALLCSSLDVNKAAHGGVSLELLRITHCVLYVCLAGGQCVLQVKLKNC